MHKPTYPQIYIYKRIVQAKLFIDNNYSRKINLENIANEAYFSKYHFIKLFKQIYGLTPHQYLKLRRIEAAKNLLKSSRYSIIEVCFEVGFESVTSFSGLFKKVTGKTPKLFQKEHQRRQKEMSLAPLKFIPFCFSREKPEAIF